MIIARSSSKFDYSFHTPEGLTLGSLTLPTYPAFPRKGLLGNSAPQGLAHHVSIRLGERPYHVEYALLTDRAFRGNDLQYFLMQGGQTILSTVASVARSAPWDLSLDGKAYVLQKQGGLFAPLRYALTQDTTPVGQIAQTPGFTLWQRSVEIDLPPALDPAVQVFLFFLVINTSFR